MPKNLKRAVRSTRLVRMPMKVAKVVTIKKIGSKGR